MSTDFGLQVNSSAVYLRRIKVAPRTAAKLAAIAEPIVRLEVAAESALALLDNLTANNAVRLPFPQFEEIRAALSNALGNPMVTVKPTGAS